MAAILQDELAPRLGANVMARLATLATFSDEPGRITRLYLSAAHKAAAELVRTWMIEAGMTAGIDAVGNVVGRYPGSNGAGPTLLLGSHIDTVRDAGAYDGNFGVAAAIEAVAELARTGRRVRFGIEVIAFGDEEGVRFPATLGGSRALAGSFALATLEGRDQDGLSLGQALRDWGGDPDGIPALARDPAYTLGFIELHIEQGPVLEALDLPVGIVTAINGASRFAVEVTGKAGHAGTVPMALRRDALTAAAAMVLAVEGVARARQDLVATVGRFEALPGAVNTIPGSVRFTIDLRSPRDADRQDAVLAIEAELKAIARERRVNLQIGGGYDEPARACDPALMAGLEAAVVGRGLTPHRLPSGAGHDGLAMANLCPIAMLFVRCAGGISHHPTESLTAADAGTATAVLLDFLAGLDGRPHR